MTDRTTDASSDGASDRADGAGDGITDTVAVAAVTYDRHEELAQLLRSLAVQSAPIRTVALVDSGTQPATAVVDAARAANSGPAGEAGAPIHYLRSEANLGGAGGFAFAILAAIASGAQWIWLMDDDGHPEDERCLAELLRAAHEHDLDIVSPLVAATSDPTRLSFNFRINGLLTNDRAVLEPMGYLPNMVHFFNGALIRADVFSRIGLPDMKFFIRGDEVDFLARVRRAGLKYGTLATVAVRHPATWSEMKPIFGGFITPVIPDGEFKRFSYFRNRAYLARKYRNLRWFGADVIGFPYYFLTHGDLKGLRAWFAAYSAGLRGSGFGPPPSA
ncbi:glycosyltransferase family 2 protein [Arthrobacter sp. B1805]|uniref:glycosyltransferase family 2 protein n=1 Tax=Arthrobacter sp. B1805 TaxID=2058892 RepID=UPI00280591E1|nr:glycosyltransferase family 2 protein [Arthrobacter sp. B1805]